VTVVLIHKTHKQHIKYKYRQKEKRHTSIK